MSEQTEMTAFELEPVNELRRRARAAARVEHVGPEGWSKSDVDPHDLLAAFPALRLRRGYVLRAYQFRAGGNGNGFVVALPVDAPFPEPDDSPRRVVEKLPGVHLRPPRPAGALDDFMAAVEGDGSALSYLSASLFRREADELGALWHGCGWSIEAILGADPWGEDARDDHPGDEIEVPPLASATNWEWLEARPVEWRPTVTVADGEVTVRFVTYTPHIPEGIVVNEDVYAQGDLRCEVTRRPLARGPGASSDGGPQRLMAGDRSCTSR